MSTHNLSKRILIVCPSFPVVESGAEQQERAQGIRQLVRLGHEVVVIAKVVEWANAADIENAARNLGVRVVLVPYRYSNRALSVKEKLLKFMGKLRNPLYFDGAAYEFAEPVIKEALKNELQRHKPDLVWFEYTYLWPLYSLVRDAGVSIITRSQNFEPQHFLEESGRGFFNYIKYFPKLLSERRSILNSNVVLAITPKEETIYKKMGAKKVLTLPLRGLPRFTLLPRPEARVREPLHVFFMGSSYSVAHNYAAAAQVIEEVAPALARQAAGEFVFHIFGGKLPERLQKLCDGRTVVHEGYVQNLNERLQEMDIALIPSLMGAGMQQKVFEPITRGIPTITPPRAIAGYDLAAGVEYVAAETAEQCIAALLQLRDSNLRQQLSNAASQKTAVLFSQEALDAIVQKAVYDADTI